MSDNYWDITGEEGQLPQLPNVIYIDLPLTQELKRRKWQENTESMIPQVHTSEHITHGKRHIPSA